MTWGQQTLTQAITAARNPRPVPHVILEVASIDCPPKERERLPGLRRSTSPEPFHSTPFHSTLVSSSSHVARTTCVARLTDRARAAFHAALVVGVSRSDAVLVVRR